MIKRILCLPSLIQLPSISSSSLILNFHLHSSHTASFPSGPWVVMTARHTFSCVTALLSPQVLLWRRESICVSRLLTCRGCSIVFCRSDFTLFPGWLVTLVTGCLKMEAVCLMGRAVFRSGLPPCIKQIQVLVTCLI